MFILQFLKMFIKSIVTVFFHVIQNFVFYIYAFRFLYNNKHLLHYADDTHKYTLIMNGKHFSIFPFGNSRNEDISELQF